MKRTMNRYDAMLLFAALFAALALLLYQHARPSALPVRAAIYADGVRFADRPLADDQQIECRGVVIEISGGARVLSSTCPDQRCVQRGKITRAGESIVCLPNRVSIILTGEEALDAVLY